MLGGLRIWVWMLTEGETHGPQVPCCDSSPAKVSGAGVHDRTSGSQRVIPSGQAEAGDPTVRPLILSHWMRRLI